MEIHCPHCQQKNRVPAQRLKEGPRCGQCKEVILGGVIEADASTLTELINASPLPVLVDFWAPWCAPCRQFAPTFKAEAPNHARTMVFAKVDTEAHAALGQQYSIRSIPTLAVFWKGKEVERISGALPAIELKRFVTSVYTRLVSQS